MTNLKPGDEVATHYSYNGHKMTIEEIDGDIAHCCWLDGLTIKRGTFNKWFLIDWAANERYIAKERHILDSRHS